MVRELYIVLYIVVPTATDKALNSFPRLGVIGFIKKPQAAV